MSETEVRENTKDEDFVRANGFSIDLLRRFISKNNSPLKLEGTGKKYDEDLEGEDTLELSLGLSLNGRFGVDPKKLARSSSIPDFMTTDCNDNIAGHSPPAAYTPLVRTCSLPTVTEEWRKRKELQSQRRLEAKRKRLEKLKNARTTRDQEENGEENGLLHSQKGPEAINGYRELSQPFNMPNWVSSAAARGAVNGQGRELKGAKAPEPSRQGSIGSQGSGSSGISESYSLLGQGTNRPNEVRSPPNKAQPQPRQSEQKLEAAVGQENGKLGKTTVTARENGSLKSTAKNKEMKEMLPGMPYVSTTGDGPDGKRIEGFLYRYRKGEEARIVCVCHGSFLSPAEFVKHAGGGDVAHPLRHIVVNPSPLL